MLFGEGDSQRNKKDKALTLNGGWEGGGKGNDSG